MLDKYSVLITSFVLILFLLGCESEDSKAIRELNDEFSAVIDNAIDMDSPLASEKNINSTPKASGKAGQLEKFMRDTINIGIDFRNEYQGELAKIGWETLLDADRLYKDENLIQSETILKSGKEIIELYREKNNRTI